MTLTDVPPNGDCFYNVIQLSLATLTEPVPTYIPQLRQQVANFLQNTRSGKTILKHYHQSPTIITKSILPNLKPSSFPNRDIYAEEYVIAAMASMLQTTIHIYHYHPDNLPQHITFKPLTTPLQNLITTSHVPHIHIWNEASHFQLLTNSPISHTLLPSSLHPSPSNLPIHNKTPKGRITTIPAPKSLRAMPQCPYTPLPYNTQFPTSFCTTHCHPYCPNHYTAYRPVPIKIAYSQALPTLVNAVGVPKHTPLFETAGTIFKQATLHTFQITPHHHSSAITTHPVLQLITHSSSPNCTLRPLLIPEPYPHLRLFLVALTDISPYTTLSILPPPRPLPPPQPPPEPPPRLLQPLPSRIHTRITDYFKSFK